MFCPFCGFGDSKVIDSRDVENSVRRRRQCLSCNARFTTYERVQPVSLMVVKKDKRREEYNRSKLLTGIQKACEKRPLPMGTIEKMVEEIEDILFKTSKAEVSSNVIGEIVMEKLKKVDYVAYIRFASVYHEFADISTLKKEIDNLLEPKIASVISNQLPLIPSDSLELAKTKHGSRR